jgi:hypothetical protein
MNGIQGKKKLQSVQDVKVLTGTELERNDFYVYVWLDPRKPGKYKYGKYMFDHEPIYVGKGYKNRGLRFKRRECNSFLKRKLNKILSPIFIKAKENLTETEAFVEEVRMIATIGRFGKGPLTNLTNGGEGTIGFHHSEETKQILREHTLNRTPEVLEKISKAVIASLPFSKEKRMAAADKRRGVPLSPENKLKVSIGLLKVRDHLSEIKKGIPLSKEHREKISKAMKNRPPTIGRTGMPHTEETKRKMTEGLLRYYSQHENANKGKPLSKEHKEKISNATKGRKVWNSGIKYSEEMKQRMKGMK